MFPLYWSSLKPFQLLSVKSVLTQYTWEHLVPHSNPPALRCLNPWPHCLAPCQIDCPPPSHLRYHVDHASLHSCEANFWCSKWFQVLNSHQFLQDVGGFIWLSRNWLFEFVLQGGPLQSKLVAQVIIMTIKIQLLHHVESLIWTLWQYIEYLKCILPQPFICCGCKIPSVKDVDFGCTATSTTYRGPWAFGAICFAPPLSSFLSHYQYSSYPLVDYHRLISCYWWEQTALLQLFREGSRL